MYRIERIEFFVLGEFVNEENIGGVDVVCINDREKNNSRNGGRVLY